MIVRRVAVLLALSAAGCSSGDAGDLRRQNEVLRARLAEVEARLQDCNRSTRRLVDVQDAVGSGSGIDLDAGNGGLAGNDMGASIGSGMGLGSDAGTGNDASGIQ